MSIKSKKPEALQVRVVERHMNGESDREIGKKERIHRSTVKRIRSQPEVLKIIAEQKNRILLMTPKATDVYQETLCSNDPKLRFAAATVILKSTTVIEQGSGNAKDGRFTLTESDFEIDRQHRVNVLALNQLSLEDVDILRDNWASDSPGVPPNKEEERVLAAYGAAVEKAKSILDKS